MQLGEDQKTEGGGLAANQGVGTVNGAAIDMLEYGALVVALNVGAAGAGGTLDVNVQESADGSTGWANIAGAAFTQIIDSTDDQVYVGQVSAKAAGRLRYFRVVRVVAVATVPNAVTTNKIQPEKVPAQVLQFKV
jgi:hypothetical protein